MHPKKYLFFFTFICDHNRHSIPKKELSLKSIAEIGIIITFGQCFKYVSIYSIGPREGQRKKDVFVVCVGVLSLRICIPSYYIHFLSCLQFRIFSQWQKIVLETN